MVSFRKLHHWVVMETKISKCIHLFDREKACLFFLGGEGDNMYKVHFWDDNMHKKCKENSQVFCEWLIQIFLLMDSMVNALQKN